MCRVSPYAPESSNARLEAGQTGGLSEYLTRILDQLSPSSWLPAIMVVANVAVLMQLCSQRNFDIGHAITTLTKAPVGTLIVLILAIVLTSVVTQAFAFSVIRVLEGYWGSRRLLIAWSNLLTRYHVRRLARLAGRFDRYEREAFNAARDQMLANGVPRHIAEILDRQQSGDSVDRYDPAMVAHAEGLGWRRFTPPELLHKMDATQSLLDEYPRPHRILPTMLGNTLRSREDQLEREPSEPLEEYVLRRYSAMSPDLWTQHRRARSQLDIYCLLTLIFGALAALSPAALFLRTSNVPGALCFAVGYAVLSVISYRAAIVCARGYTSVLRAIGSRSVAGGPG